MFLEHKNKIFSEILLLPDVMAAQWLPDFKDANRDYFLYSRKVIIYVLQYYKIDHDTESQAMRSVQIGWMQHCRISTWESNLKLAVRFKHIKQYCKKQ